MSYRRNEGLRREISAVYSEWKILADSSKGQSQERGRYRKEVPIIEGAQPTTIPHCVHICQPPVKKRRSFHPPIFAEM